MCLHTLLCVVALEINSYMFWIYIARPAYNSDITLSISAAFKIIIIGRNLPIIYHEINVVIAFTLQRSFINSNPW
jgi:hypothetical protein